MIQYTRCSQLVEKTIAAITPITVEICRFYDTINNIREVFLCRLENQRRIIWKRFWFYPKKAAVRSVDIASMLGVSKPSVSHAMKLLREDGYIAMDRYGTVTLMDKGSEIAHRIYERHTVLTKMLEGLGVSPEVARADACKMEHDVSDESFEKIKEHLTAKGEI